MKKVSLAFIAAALLLVWNLPATPQAAARNDGWISMFDGKTLDGWKANERPESWTVRDGAITGDGEASHLFYMGQECGDCEFKADVKIGHEGNSGMYFRTAFGPGFPKGYEAQVNSSHKDPVRTGSLYSHHKVLETLIPDDVWGTQHIIAKGNHIIIKVNDKVATDYVDEGNKFTKGYFALQQHNKGSVVQYRNLMYRVIK